jgi:hypothetical protein
MSHPGRPLAHREELLWLLPVAAACLVLFLAGQAVGSGAGLAASDLTRGYVRMALRTLPVFAFLLVLPPLIWSVLKSSPSPFADLAHGLARRYGSPLLLAAGLAPLVLLPIMFSGYGALKMAIPDYVPFSWDDRLAALDRLLFFGSQPWELTHALAGGATATAVIDRIYTLWILMLSIAILGFALFAPRYDRARFFLAFTVAWILLGVGGGYLFSSAGPCYAELVGARSAVEFAPMMARLREISEMTIPLGAVQWQDVLWQAHVNDQPSFGMGISAMPSLHNAIAILYALALGRFGRAAAIGGWLYAAIIFFGSVHLGWHYAVDGLLAAAGMAAIWWGAGRYLEASGYANSVASEKAVEPARGPAMEAA